MSVSRERAADAIREKIAEPLGLSVEEAAAGMLRIATSHMTQAIELNSVRKGFDPREFALVAFGGAGPVFAPDIAAELQIPDIVAPRYPGIASAMGLLGSDMVHDFRGTVVAAFGALDLDALEQRFQEMESRAEAQLVSDGFAESDTAVSRYVECRYAGQGYEIRFDAPQGTCGAEWLEATRQAFHRVHEREYAHAFEESEVELVNIGVEGIGRIEEVELPELGVANGQPATPTSEREVWFEASSGMVMSKVYSRPSLLAGHTVPGPAVIEQEDSTVLVPPGQNGRVDKAGNVVISSGGQA
jgi:N-methylhydantoinase A/oxoprolinase/acetone carboxylase beta subunit